MPPVHGWYAPGNAPYRSARLKRIAVSMSAKRHIGGAGSRLHRAWSKPMSSLDFDLDTQMSRCAEPAAELLQRRWFAAAAAVKNVDAECEVLLEVLELSREAWHAARERLAKLQTLRDTLGEQLANDPAPRREEMSAA
jgi:hypothetical protein